MAPEPPPPTAKPRATKLATRDDTLTFLITVLRHTHRGQIDYTAISTDPAVTNRDANSAYWRLYRLLRKESLSITTIFGDQRGGRSSKAGGVKKEKEKEKAAGTPGEGRAGKKRKCEFEEEVEEEGGRREEREEEGREREWERKVKEEEVEFGFGFGFEGIEAREEDDHFWGV